MKDTVQAIRRVLTTAAAITLLLTSAACGGGDKGNTDGEATEQEILDYWAKVEDEAGLDEPPMYDDHEVVSHLGLVWDDEYEEWFWTAPDGTRCDVGDVLTSPAEVKFWSADPDPVATNPDRTAGVTVVDAEEVRTCYDGLVDGLADFPQH